MPRVPSQRYAEAAAQAHILRQIEEQRASRMPPQKVLSAMALDRRLRPHHFADLAARLERQLRAEGQHPIADMLVACGMAEFTPLQWRAALAFVAETMAAGNGRVLPLGLIELPTRYGIPACVAVTAINKLADAIATRAAVQAVLAPPRMAT